MGEVTDERYNMAIGFGISAAGPEISASIAHEVETLGYSSIWTNDTPAEDGLATASSFLASTRSIDVGIGVLPLDRRTPSEITREIERLNLDQSRLIVGVGAGFSATPIRLVRSGVSELRELLEARIAIAAMGPLMCRLAGEIGDSVLLNWMTPERIRLASERISEGELNKSKKTLRAAYIRLAIGPDAETRLQQEATRYASMPHYQRSMGTEPGIVGIALANPDNAAVSEALDSYENLLDLTIVRSLPKENTIEDILTIARTAAPT